VPTLVCFKIVLPNQLFILFTGGVLALYCAIIFSAGRLLGFAGIACAWAAVYLAANYQIHLAGCVFLATAAVLYGLEFRWKIDYVAGTTGAILLPIGFGLLYSGPERIGAALAIPFGLTLGMATAALCWSAKRARINKTADL
jgi:hypothetical protein